MELFEKVSGHCDIYKIEVDVLVVKHKKTKQKNEIITPVRCQGASKCPRSTFCKFVNPLTTHIPVTLGGASVPGKAEAS